VVDGGAGAGEFCGQMFDGWFGHVALLLRAR